VEQAFGVLVARWGILWKPLQFGLHRSTKVVDVALKLHNFCIQENEACMSTSMSPAERRSNVETFAGWMQRATARFASNAGRRSDLQRSMLREALVAEVGDNVRPASLITDY